MKKFNPKLHIRAGKLRSFGAKVPNEVSDEDWILKENAKFIVYRNDYINNSGDLFCDVKLLITSEFISNK